MSKKKKRRKAALMPRRGPATNLRPAGTHESLVQYNRKRQKAATRREVAQDLGRHDYDAD
jgi:hypothetical protein